ncbi:MAG: DedA family protein [Candidatus Njordarchaeia archaeon]
MKKRIFYWTLLIVSTIIAIAFVTFFDIRIPTTGLTRATADFITNLIHLIGYLGVFILMTLESALIPIPSEVIMVFAGYISYLGHFSILFTVIVGTFGNLLGSLIAYIIGLKGGRPFILRYGKYFFISERHLEEAENLFRTRGDFVILAGRMLPAIRTVISFPAGLGKMNLRRFTIFTFIGSIPWNLMLTLVGFYLGPYWMDILSFFEKVDIIIGISFIIALVIYLKT